MLETIDSFSTPHFGVYSNQPSYQPPVNTNTTAAPISSNFIYHNENALIDIDNKINKYSDFVSICYVMFVWSILCFLISIWIVTSFKGEFPMSEIENNYYKWYEIFNLFANLFHCGVYFYSIRTYNHQDYNEMIIVKNAMICLCILNIVYMFIYIFVVSKGFLIFCVDLIYLVFNVLLYFQAKELSSLYEQKITIKIVYG